MAEEPLLLKSKARTLAALQGKVSSCVVLPLAYFSVAEWRSRPDALCTELVTRFGAHPLIVRSSACGEDSAEALLAGKFTSVQDVSGLA